MCLCHFLFVWFLYSCSFWSNSFWYWCFMSSSYKKCISNSFEISLPYFSLDELTTFCWTIHSKNFIWRILVFYFSLCFTLKFTYRDAKSWQHNPLFEDLFFIWSLCISSSDLAVLIGDCCSCTNSKNKMLYPPTLLLWTGTSLSLRRLNASLISLSRDMWHFDSYQLTVPFLWDQLFSNYFTL